MTLKSVLNNIKTKKLAPVYLLTGSEENLKSEIEEAIIDKYIPESVRPFNITKFNDKNTNLNEVLNMAQNVPIMSPLRLVILEEDCAFLETKDDKLINDFKKYLENPPDSSVLIIREKKPDKRRVIYRALKKKSVEVNLEKLKLPELTDWLKEKVKPKAFKANALDLFIQRTHYLDNQSVKTENLLNLLEQLKSFTGDKKEIDVKDVAEVIPKGVDDNVFDLVDNAVKGDLRDLKRTLTYLSDHGESPIALFALVLYQIRTIAKVKLLSEYRLSNREMAAKAGISPYILNRYLQMSRNFSKEAIFKLIKDAADLDFKVKTGQIDPMFALEYLILKINKKS